MKTIKSDAWDSGNRLTQFKEIWGDCQVHGQYEMVEPDEECPMCQELICNFCGESKEDVKHIIDFGRICQECLTEQKDNEQ